MPARKVVEWAVERFGDKIALATSFSKEDTVLTDMLLDVNPNAPVFTLDTGRLNEQTYEVWEATNRRYAVNIPGYHPDAADVEKLLAGKGAFSFRNSIEERRECCGIRKVKPLKRALEGLDAWMTGLRQEQSETRRGLEKIVFDEPNKIMKINPLADWIQEDVDEYIRKKRLPYNTLYDIGYASIGCEPCTRPVEKGERARAGRWWWEDPQTKECGLHPKEVNG